MVGDDSIRRSLFQLDMCRSGSITYKLDWLPMSLFKHMEQGASFLSCVSSMIKTSSRGVFPELKFCTALPRPSPTMASRSLTDVPAVAGLGYPAQSA